MSFDVLNPWMLAGLAGIALPVLAHLLSKKKYDVVQWGAMQFLELGRETRRRVRLEEFLLLLIRILLICLIVFLFARPWASGGLFKNLVSAQPRDVVIIVDGSFSMGWQDGMETPHQKAINWAREFLNDLGAGDTVALIDARDQARIVIEKPTRDIEWVREELRNLPAPSGSSNLAEAATRAVQILSQTTHLEREILILTDGQSRPWSVDDPNRWLRFDDLLQQPVVRPRLWCVDVTREESDERVNLTVGPIQLSRELTVTDFPVRISTTVGYSGGDEPIMKRIDLQINGETVPGRSVSVQLQPDGETTVEFEHRFASVGSYVIGVAVDGDALPGDNESLAAIEVNQALPVLLVDGDRHLDPTRNETFFAQIAFSPATKSRDWIRAETVSADDWKTENLDRYRTIVLANVSKLPREVIRPLRSHVANGGGLFIALGDQCDPTFYNETLFEQGLIPALLRKQSQPPEPDQPTSAVTIAPETLELPWLKRFQNTESSLRDVRFDRWWSIDALSPIATDEDSEHLSEPVTAARFSTGEPLLVTAELGRGRVLVMSAPLDADWSTLPAKPDYVAFLHEAIFYLASAGVERNLLPGLPFVMPVEPDFPADEYAVFDPSGTPHDIKVVGSSERASIRFAETQLPGRYSLEKTPRNSDLSSQQFFVVDYDRGESDLTPLTEADRTFLTDRDRMQFVVTQNELREQLLTDTSRAELWRWIVFLFLGFLVFELWMTKRLVQGGHATDEILDQQMARAEEFEADSPPDPAASSQPVAEGRFPEESSEETILRS
ncbi:MAG: VWA domain-containing protein [Planctomycetaceae bacterium]|nr:VWA domain-containing protein [Planctomycetaceae bacterium]